jgi:hypothetical protein
MTIKKSFILIGAIFILMVSGAVAQLAATSQMGYHPDSAKQVVMYTSASSGTFEIRTTGTGTNSAVFTGILAKPKDFYGNDVNCQGNNPCLVGKFTDFKTQGTFIARAAAGGQTKDSYPFEISNGIYSNNLPILLEFYEAQEQRGSAYHADMHKAMDPPLLTIADGSFILTSEQASIGLIRLGSAYNRNPAIFNAASRQNIKTYADYLSGLQGVQVQERTDGVGFRLNAGMKINNAFVPGPTGLQSIGVYSPGNPPNLIQQVSVTSLCGQDNGSPSWDECMSFAADYYKCQANEPCLNLTYVEKTGVVGSRSGFSMPVGWIYDWGCFLDMPLTQGVFNTDENPCLLFDRSTTRRQASMALLAFLESVPAVYDISPTDGQVIYSRAVATHDYIKSNYPDFGSQDNDAGFFGAALFLLYDYSGNSDYLRDAHAMRSKIPTVLHSGETHGNEYYWEEYARHRSQIESLGLSYLYNGEDPAQFFRGKMYGDYKDRGERSISKNGERVYIYDNNIQFQNSRYILIEGVIAAKTMDLIQDEEPFIREVADNQLSWITGMNGVQQGVASGSPITSYSFIFGIGEKTPIQFHSRYMIDTGYRQATGGKLIGARGTDLLWKDGSDFVYFDGTASIMGQQFGATGNGYNGEPKTMPFKSPRTFNNGKQYIPGWINGAYDTVSDTDVIFNYLDDANTYEYTETTDEIVGVAVELFSYLDAVYNSRQEHAPVMFSGTIPLPPINTTPPPTNTTPPPTNTTLPPDQDGCFTNVQYIPATCTGGSITSDIFDGGRQIVCEQGGSRLRVDAWDKPTFTDADYFEMYKIGGTGSGLMICMGETCISSGDGYAKSPAYPICPGNTTTPPVVPPDTNVTPPPPAEDGTYYSLESIPAACTGGSITSDVFDGGRRIECSGEGKTMRIDAWDKPTATSPEYFEMYKISESAPGLKICIGDTCIFDNGYARSPDYPITFNGDGGDDGEDPGGDGQLSAHLSISQWYPKLSGDVVEYLFVCSPTEGSGSYSFDWMFGDGQQLFGYTYMEAGDSKVMHTYPYTDQQYDVRCVVHDLETEEEASGIMTVNPISYQEEIP